MGIRRILHDQRHWLPAFFALAACSWMPHWSCHYYRLETGSSFVVGSWSFSRAESLLSLLVYTGLVGLNLIAVVVAALRVSAAFVSGVGHCILGMIHVVRIFRPFEFEVFGYSWSRAASIREAAVVTSFGMLCFLIGWNLRRREA